MTQPAAVFSDGNVKVAYVPAIANTAAPTVAELTAVAAQDLSCYLTADGWNPNTDEQVATDDRLCSKQTFENRGRFTDSLEISYVYNIPSSADDEARTTLTAGTTGFIVARWGEDYETAFAAADVVDVYPVTLGVQRKQPAEANSVLRITQKPFVTGTVQRDVAVAA